MNYTDCNQRQIKKGSVVFYPAMTHEDGLIVRHGIVTKMSGGKSNTTLNVLSFIKKNEVYSKKNVVLKKISNITVVPVEMLFSNKDLFKVIKKNLKNIKVNFHKNHGNKISTKEEFNNIVKDNIFELIFIKQNGEERTLIGTKDFNKIPTVDHPRPKSISGVKRQLKDNIVKLYDLEDSNWKSIRLDSILKLSQYFG